MKWVEIQAAVVRARVLNHDLEDLADVGGEGARHVVEAAVGQGARVGGEFEGVVLVQGDEVGFARVGFRPGGAVQGPDGSVVDDLVCAQGHAAGDFAGGGEVGVWGEGFELVVEPAVSGVGESEGRFGWVSDCFVGGALVSEDSV